MSVCKYSRKMLRGQRRLQSAFETRILTIKEQISMKAFFLTEKQIKSLIVNVANNSYRSPEDMTLRAISELEAAHCPISIDDLSVKEISTQCKFYPESHIIGFTHNDTVIKGVFVKE